MGKEKIGGVLGKLMYVLAMCWRDEALQSGRKGGVRLVPKGVRMEVRCVPK